MQHILERPQAQPWTHVFNFGDTETLLSSRVTSAQRVQRPGSLSRRFRPLSHSGVLAGTERPIGGQSYFLTHNGGGFGGRGGETVLVLDCKMSIRWPTEGDNSIFLNVFYRHLQFPADCGPCSGTVPSKPYPVKQQEKHHCLLGPEICPQGYVCRMGAFFPVCCHNKTEGTAYMPCSVLVPFGCKQSSYK